MVVRILKKQTNKNIRQIKFYPTKLNFIRSQPTVYLMDSELVGHTPGLHVHGLLFLEVFLRLVEPGQAVCQ